MAGKITFKKGIHPSRVGGWVQPVKLTDAQLASLGSYVGRAITDDEVLYIEDMLETVKGIRDAGDDTRSQDVIETLAAIARADDDEVHRALDHCDEFTRAVMTDALRKMGEAVPWEFARFRPAKLKAAASIARVRGHKPVKGYRVVFARGFAEVWLAMTGTPGKHWAIYDNSASPGVKAAQLLLEVIGEPRSASTVAKLLRKVIA